VQSSLSVALPAPRDECHFITDQNFPAKAAHLEFPPSVKLTTLSDYDSWLTQRVDDWELFVA